MTNHLVPRVKYVCGNCKEEQYYPWSVTENGTEYCSYQCANADNDRSVPYLDEIESEREFATHILFYGYSEKEVERLSEEQFMWLRRWG